MEAQQPVVPGSRFGPYEILSSLGAGGMGEVYRARDERLDRIVALKILAPDRSCDPELRGRLQREARALSRLSHPNVCAVFDVGAEGGRDYFVMELLAGETLAERLQREPLSLDQTLDVGAQIASALDTSHRPGLVHRDLKPANVILTPSGVKLLDFGIARFAPFGSAASRDTATAAGNGGPLSRTGCANSGLESRNQALRRAVEGAARGLPELRGSATKRSPKDDRKMTVAGESQTEREAREVGGMRQLVESSGQPQLREVSVQRDPFDSAKNVCEIRR
jgi:serine/threonine protein kinase